MDQGTAEFGRTLSLDESRSFLQALNLREVQIGQQFPLQRVSTGLRYLIVPILHGLENARIAQAGLRLPGVQQARLELLWSATDSANRVRNLY